MIGYSEEVPLRTQRRVIQVGQGIFALRYLSSASNRSAPAVAVEPGREDVLTLIGAPGCPDRVLSRPGQCLLIRAERPASLTLTVAGRRPAAGLDASLRLERVAGPTGPWGTPGLAGLDAADGRDLAGEPRIDLLAHLARRGDVVVPMGEWIGGPRRPGRIEGIAVRWPGRPADVELTCTVVSKGRRLRRLPDVATGEFAGTRGEAAPLVGFELALEGEGASRFRLSGEALFDGAPLVSGEGRRLRFAGPTGREPLLGLRLSVEPVSQTTAAEIRTLSGPTGSHLTGRVRVFRGAAASAA